MRDEQELLTDCLRRNNALGLRYILTGSMAGNLDLCKAVNLIPVRRRRQV
jgi:hypothetical protein